MGKKKCKSGEKDGKDKKPRFECERCGRKDHKEKHLCKPVKIKKN